jgi:hypothetical protein
MIVFQKLHCFILHSAVLRIRIRSDPKFLPDPDPESDPGENHYGSGSGQPGPRMKRNKTSLIKFSVFSTTTVHKDFF